MVRGLSNKVVLFILFCCLSVAAVDLSGLWIFDSGRERTDRELAAIKAEVDARYLSCQNERGFILLQSQLREFRIWARDF